MRTDEEEYFVIGAPEPQYYMHWKENGCGGCFTDCSDPEEAERFDTRKEARHFMVHDSDAREWVKNMNHSFHVRVIRVKRIVKVYD